MSKAVVIHLALFLVLIGFGSCNVDENFCDEIVQKTFDDTCTINASHVELSVSLLYYGAGELTRDEFRTFFDDYCFRVANHTSCILENADVVIPQECKNSKQLSSTLLFKKYSQLFAEYYCEHDRNRQMESIDDDGVDCLFSDAHIGCLSDALPNINKYHTIQHTCLLIDSTIGCQHKLSECKNQNVKHYRADLFRILKHEFNCL